MPRGFVVPPETVVCPAALKKVMAISSVFAAELISSTGIGNEERLLSFSKASVDPLKAAPIPQKDFNGFQGAVLPDAHASHN